MNYKAAYEKYEQYQEMEHQRNQQRIQVGLKVNIFLPLVFLIISFITNASKLVFLILWIVSLFGISAYLIYVEYMDYKLQTQLLDFRGKQEEVQPQLIGSTLEAAGDQLNQRMDQIDSLIEEGKQKVAEGRQKVVERLESAVDGVLNKDAGEDETAGADDAEAMDATDVTGEETKK